MEIFIDASLIGLGAICSKTRIYIFNQLKKTESYQFFEISNGISCFKIVHSPDEKILRINNSIALSYINCTQLIIEFCTKDLEKGTRPFYLYIPSAQTEADVEANAGDLGGNES